MHPASFSFNMPGCEEIKEALVECIKHTDCMTKEQRTFHDCLAGLPSMEGEQEDICKRFRLAYFECKRSQINMRMRFREAIR